MTAARISRPRLALLAAVLAIGVAIGLFVLIRSMSGATVDVEGRTVQCSGWSGVNADRCAAWGREMLAAGAPSNTFELEDVGRLRLERPGFGFADRCAAEYFLNRYPDEPVWTDEVDCPN